MTAEKQGAVNVCGGGHMLDGKLVGCGERFTWDGEMFRCTDCKTAFHRQCARDHFARSQTHEGMRNLERDIGDYLFEQANGESVAEGLAKKVRTGEWRVDTARSNRGGDGE